MVYRVASGTAASQVGLRLKIDASLSGLCVRTGEVLRCDDRKPTRGLIGPLVGKSD